MYVYVYVYMCICVYVYVYVDVYVDVYVNVYNYDPNQQKQNAEYLNLALTWHHFSIELGKSTVQVSAALEVQGGLGRGWTPHLWRCFKMKIPAGPQE